MSTRVYTETEKQLALTAGSRIAWGRWEVYTKSTGHSKGFLVGVEPGSTVTYDYMADVKRVCSLSVREDPDTALDDDEITWADVDTQRDVISPWWYIQMPDGGNMSFRKGVFLMEAGTRSRRVGGGVYVVVNGFDQTITLNRDLATTTGFYTVASAVNIIDQVQLILGDAGITEIQIPDSPLTTTAVKTWDQGTPLRQVVNELLTMAAYGSVYFDDNGTARAGAYIVPSSRVVDFTYLDDPSTSVMWPDVTETFDVWDVPNRWVYVVSQTDQSMLTSTFDNLSPSSPTSQITRGYIQTDFQSNIVAATQEALDTLVRQAAHEASQVYREITLLTLTMPEHGENNIIDLTLTDLGIGASDSGPEAYEEIGWTMAIDENGQAMTHTIRKIVNVDLAT